jgi:hypothetical protein
LSQPLHEDCACAGSEAAGGEPRCQAVGALESAMARERPTSAAQRIDAMCQQRKSSKSLESLRGARASSNLETPRPRSRRAHYAFRYWLRRKAASRRPLSFECDEPCRFGFTANRSAFRSAPRPSKGRRSYRNHLADVDHGNDIDVVPKVIL